MRLVLALCVLLSAGTGFSDEGHRVSISGKTFSTGYLPFPKGTARPYRALKPFDAAELPESYDSRDHGLVTPIKDQGNCGSCWSFARTRALETAMLKAGKLSPDLAEQDTLVNDRSGYKCSGGFMDGAYETEHGVTKESVCPYKANNSSCRSDPVEQQATRWAMLPGSPSDDELRAAIVEYGTLFVTVAAGGSFSPDSEGRITRCSSFSVNHMVTLSGYRPAPSGSGYEFLIGNSWGTSWGDGGYAWSKKGCNKLASSSGDAAGYFYVEGGEPPPPPPPPPPPAGKLELPTEVTYLAANGAVAVQVRATPPGRKCKWSTGETGCRVWVQPTTATSYSVTVKDVGKDPVTQSVKVVPQ
jgi:hypothetical protein